MGSLGEQLKQIRDEAGLSLQDLSEKTKIQLKYLERLENEEFDRLPKLVYVRGFIQKWASVCGADPEQLMLQFYRENQPIISGAKEDIELASLPTPSFVITAKHIIGVLLLLVSVSLLGYFYQNQRELSQAPQIEVVDPANVSSTSEEDIVSLKGETQNIETVIINGENARLSSDGTFNFPYKLQAGLNTIFIKAKAYNGEEVETVRKILKLGEEGVQEVKVEDTTEE